MKAEKSIWSEAPPTTSHWTLVLLLLLLTFGLVTKLRISPFHPALSHAHWWTGGQNIATDADVSLLLRKDDWTATDLRGTSDLAVPVTATPLRKCHRWTVISPSFRVSGKQR